MDYIDILDDAMYSGEMLAITTKSRGKIVGVPHSVDEYETDDDRLGYFIEVDDHTLYTVYLDEIISINISSSKVTA